MNKLPEIFFAVGGEKDQANAGFLILNNPTPYLAKIIQYKDYPTMLEHLNTKEPVAYSVVPGYSIAIIYAGILGRGHKLNPEALETIQQVMQDMAAWYRENRIKPHLPRFKRYLI